MEPLTDDELDTLANSTLIGASPDLPARSVVELLSLRQQLAEVTAGRDRLRAELNVARVGLMAVEDLIDESKGVYGLHLNGDPAPWSEIRGHGRLCEWLEDYDVAVLAAVAETKETNGG